MITEAAERKFMEFRNAYLGHLIVSVIPQFASQTSIWCFIKKKKNTSPVFQTA